MGKTPIRPTRHHLVRRSPPALQREELVGMRLIPFSQQNRRECRNLPFPSSDNQIFNRTLFGKPTANESHRSRAVQVVYSTFHNCHIIKIKGILCSGSHRITLNKRANANFNIVTKRKLVFLCLYHYVYKLLYN